MAVVQVSSILLVFKMTIICSFGAVVQFFEESNFQGSMYQARSSAICTNLPTGAHAFIGSIKASDCIILFLTKDCEDYEQALSIQSEEKWLNESIYETSGAGKPLFSFGFCKNNRKRRAVCDSAGICNKLQASVFKLEFLPKESDLVGTVQKLEMTFPSSTQNSGSEHITSFLEKTQAISERAEFGFNPVLKDIDAISFERGALRDFEASIPFFYSNAVKKLKEGLPTAFQSSTSPKSHWVATTTEFEVNQTISVPPCRIYSENSYAEIRNNIKISYKIHLKITGELEKIGKKLTEKEICTRFEVDKAQLSFVDGDPNTDEFTAVALSSATLNAKYVSSLVVSVEGKSLPNCKW